MAARKHDLIVLQLEDPGESQLPDVGFVEWMNAETGRTNWVDTSSPAVRKEYAEKQAARKIANQELFDSLGIDSCTLDSDGGVFLPLMSLFKRRK